MPNIKKYRCLSLILSLCVLCTLTACGKYRKAEKSDAIEYIENRYQTEIQSITETKRDRNQRECLDTSASPYSNDSFDYDERDNADIIFEIEDKNGIHFHMVQMYQYGWVGYYRITEDYLVQLLRSKPELYENLENSPYRCRYVNTIGADDIPHAGFELFLSNFEDVRPAVTLAYESIMQENALLPDTEAIPEYLSAHNLIPRITFIAGEKTTLGNIQYRTTGNAERDDLQEYIRILEQEYVQQVRNGTISEELSKDILNTYGPKQITEVYYAGNKIPNFRIYYGRDKTLETDWDCYIVWDNDKKTEDCDIYYDDLDRLLTSVGYHMTCDKDSITWTNDQHSVTIRGNNKNRICMHNGEEYQPEGILNTALVKFTEKDLRELFGIRLEIDKIAETAEILLE